MIKYTVLLFALIATSCSKAQDITNSIEPNDTISILFVGNSLTYTNNLPELVKNSAKQKGIQVETSMIALPNYAILDHWDDGEVQKQISTVNYDYVIIQQGPSSQAFGREILFEYGAKYKSLCNKNGAKLCYFMV